MMSAPADLPAVILGRTEVSNGPVSALVLRCGGEIDSFNAHQLAEAVTDGLARMDAATTKAATGERRVVVDLRAVSFLGASAVTALLMGVADAPTAGAELRLVAGNTRPVLLVIDALHLRSAFPVHDDLAQALRPGE